VRSWAKHTDVPALATVLGVVLSVVLLAVAPVLADDGALPSVSAAAQRERALAVHLLELDAVLARVQRRTRAYVGAWTVLNSGLSGAQVAIAASSDDSMVRSNYYVGAGLSAAGLVVLLAQPWPGLFALDRYRAQPTGSFAERVAKLGYGERLLARQGRWDSAAVAPAKHVLAWVVAVGAGVRAGMGFDSVVQGVGRGAFVLAVLEGQILTRPRQYRADTGAAVALLPWAERGVLGARVAACF
jgi:hypothetical protein